MPGPGAGLYDPRDRPRAGGQRAINTDPPDIMAAAATDVMTACGLELETMMMMICKEVCKEI